MPANKPNKNAVRLSADDIRWISEVLEDCASTWDKHDPDSRDDIKRARSVVDALATFDQAVDVWLVYRADRTRSSHGFHLGQEGALAAFLDEDLAREDARRRYEESKGKSEYVYERLFIS